jgi:cystathionine gamma-synthase/cystathionine gamma-lyase/cystathionine beta-lyase
MARSQQTDCVHAGADDLHRGAAVMPVYGCTVFELTDGVAYRDIRYPRLSNTPNHVAVAARVAALEGAEAGLVTASGMAAITTTLFEVLARGGHLIATHSAYGGSYHFAAHDLPDFGMSASFVDANQAHTWEAALEPHTRAIYVEAIDNPTTRVPDHEAVIAFARQHGLLAIVDSTFATPINFQPLALGYDIAIHSATKYLNGHSDLAAGAIASSRELIDRIRGRLNHFGGSLPAQGCALLERGLKTLPLRVAQQNKTALALATVLEAHPGVQRVHYPGLASHPDHDRATRLFSGFGGMLAIELTGGAAAAIRLVERLSIPIYAASLGGPETLVVRPAASSHLDMTPEERLAAGVTDGLLRISCGLEGTADLIDDFTAALQVSER